MFDDDFMKRTEKAYKQICVTIITVLGLLALFVILVNTGVTTDQYQIISIKEYNNSKSICAVKEIDSQEVKEFKQKTKKITFNENDTVELAHLGPYIGQKSSWPWWSAIIYTGIACLIGAQYGMVSKFSKSANGFDNIAKTIKKNVKVKKEVH